VADNPFDELAARIADLDRRVSDLEEWRVAHNLGMTRRQQQINAMGETVSRERWRTTLRRGRR